jgi:Zn-dependent protease
VPTFLSEIKQQSCKRCSSPLAADALSCPACHALVHADEMERLAEQARESERRGDLATAQKLWSEALALLPADSQQSAWIREHLRELDSAQSAAHRQKTAGQSGGWAKKLGPLAPLAFILAKAKTFLFAIFKLKFLFSFAAFIGLYWSMWGMKFGIGFALLILIHEMGHFIEVKRRGLPAEMPVFLPGLGAYVRWQAMGVSLETRAAVSLAGPLAGFFSAAVCGLIGIKTGDPIWLALARTAAWLNAANLIPIWVLDGAGAMMPLSLIERSIVMLVAGGVGYATHEGLFYFVAGGTLINIIFAAWSQRHAALATPHGAFQSQPPQDSPQGSPMIAVYFIALITALGLVLYFVPNHGPRLLLGQ